MMLDSKGILILALVMGVWMAAAIAMLMSGLAMRTQASSRLRALQRLGSLVETSPAIPLLVMADGRLRGSDRLGRLLGFDRLPDTFSGLSGGKAGLSPEDLERLDGHIARTRASGAEFTMQLELPDSQRCLRLVGQQPDRKTGDARSVILWVFDATEDARAMRSHKNEAKRARNAFTALSGLIEAAPIPMWFRAEDLSLMLVNTAYVHAVGGDNADQVVREGIELVEPVDGLSPLAVAARALEQGEMIERRLSVTIAGQRRSMHVVDLPLGERGVAGYALDIQELQQAYADLRRFRFAQRDMLDHLSTAVAQFDRKKQLIFSNQPFLRLFDLKPQWVEEELEFDRLLDRMRETGRIPDQRDYQQWRAEREQWFQAQAAVEENWLLADGSHLRAIAQPTPDDGLLLIFEDRTEQVQLAGARDTLLRVRTATFNNLFEALAVFTADGRLHLWNNRFRDIWQIEETQLAEHPRADELMEKLAGRLKDKGRITALREVVRAATLDRVQRNGEIIMADDAMFSFTGIPLPDGNAMLTMIDVSAARKIEQALRDRNEALVEADSVKTRFLANMSYEFRTPLTSIGGFAELLDSGIAGELSDQGKDYVRAIIDSVERLSAQINNVLDLSQGEAGTLPLRMEPQEVVSLLEEIAEKQSEFARQNKITLETSIEPSLGTLNCDAVRLSQAINAVLDNAIRYTGEGGRVLLHADRFRGRVRIVVSDNGPGLDSKAQARALDGFLNGEGDLNGSADASQPAGGRRRTGLGLPLARNLVKAHGGTLELISEPGEGMVVTMLLGSS